MTDIIIKSSDIIFSHPAHRTMGSGDYMQIIIKDLVTDKEKIIYTGTKWDEKKYYKKLNNER